jgi:2-polyprenyl-3-methyl-5-hydroxy-6-metoxy-1,4-benzoquinol methylase
MQLNNRDKEYIETYSNKSISFDDFRSMAKDPSLSAIEKIGFPEAYRKNNEELILEDISSKLSNLNKPKQKILDIGSGCSKLTELLIDKSKILEHELILCDSEEMLELLENLDFVKKITGKFPYNIEKMTHLTETLDGILVYSVLQHVILEDSIFNFIDSSLALLKSGGQLLIGDIPNISKRERFFSSNAGIESHQKYTHSNTLPKLNNHKLLKNKIDDSILMSIMQRYRNFGFETYLLAQNPQLLMSNRREDILIVKH